MSRRHYNLPPLTTLSAFEAAARIGSFKEAAGELSVTPGAVSHQIKALEGELGFALFERRHRGVELTQNGKDLQEVLSASFSQISQQLQKLRSRGDDAVVTVGSTTAVAALWLSPAIIAFWREHPNVSINQVTQDRPFRNPREFDFFIRYGRDPDSTLNQTEIYRDDLVPVAAPELAADLRGCSLEVLARQRLIHLDAAPENWTSWKEWFHELGHQGDLATGARVTSYSVALQIARQNAGVALGWRRLVHPLLRSGKLAIVEGHTIPAPSRFYLVGQTDAELSQPAQQLKDWLLTDGSQVSD